MLNLGVRRCKMAKKQKIDLQSVGVLAALAFAWTKLGLGDAIKEVGAVIQPDQVAGVVRPVNGRCPAGWVKIGNQCVKL